MQADIAGRHALSAIAVRPPGRWRYKALGPHPGCCATSIADTLPDPSIAFATLIGDSSSAAGRPPRRPRAATATSPHVRAMQTWGHRHASDLRDLEKRPNMPNSARPLGVEASRRGRCRRMAVRPADWSDRTAIDPGGRRSTLPRCRTELLAADTLQQRIQPTLAPLIARRGRWPRHVVPKPTIGTRAPKMPCNPSARRICLSVAHRRDFRSVIVARSIVPASWEPI
jgi:hypothetical protein